MPLPTLAIPSQRPAFQAKLVVPGSRDESFEVLPVATSTTTNAFVTGDGPGSSGTHRSRRATDPSDTACGQR
jgi:hypothetical protein